MGGIIGSKTYFIESLIEIAGYKAGVILTQSDILKQFEGHAFYERLRPNGPAGFRLHSSEYEEAVTYLLYKLGNSPSPDNIPFSIEMFHKYKHDENMRKMYHQILDAYLKFVNQWMREHPSEKLIDPTDFIDEIHKKYQNPGLDLAIEIIKGMNRDLHRSPWGEVRNLDWKDEVDLRALFESENLESMHGQFFDQRFIDYIDRNLGEIGNIHWRQFEGLAGEYFVRQGFKVEMGAGRNDDGIDLRVFQEDADEVTPPLIILQCKRQKKKIGKAVLKSVYADVIHEKANSGLIVTSSELSPGAETMRVARSYPVETADRSTLKQWINRMRSS